jgi:probable F420-dependent oxidoreductase
MKFGLPLRGLSPRHYPEVACAAEQHGFESVWLPEHLVLPATLPSTYPYTPDGDPPISPTTALYDPWVVFGGIATVTTSIRVASNVFVLPLRHPIPTARSVLTVDRLSGGRVTLGIGVGWLEEEFATVGQSFGDRGPRTDEAVQVIRRLWSEEVIEHHGQYFDFGPVRFEPKPVQKPSIPIEIGGTSRPALRRAGRLGDGWIEIGARNIEQLKEWLAIVSRARVDADRAHLPFEVTTSLGTDLGSIRQCEEVGVTRVLASGPGLHADWIDKGLVVEWIKRFADEVIANA